MTFWKQEHSCCAIIMAKFHACLKLKNIFVLQSNFIIIVEWWHSCSTHIWQLCHCCELHPHKYINILFDHEGNLAIFIWGQWILWRYRCVQSSSDFVDRHCVTLVLNTWIKSHTAFARSICQRLALLNEIAGTLNAPQWYCSVLKLLQITGTYSETQPATRISCL